MAIGTDRAEVGDWVNQILFSDSGKLSQVVDMDKSLKLLSIGRRKRETANTAVGAVAGDTVLPGFRVPLVGVDGYLSCRTLYKLCALDNLHFVGEKILSRDLFGPIDE
jgi:hypothetical protein